MIELAPDTAFLLYLALTLMILLGIWTYHLHRAKKRKIIVSEYDLLLCEYCHCAYLATRGDNISRCPQCKSFNRYAEKNKVSKL